jgi:hypothetical protein
LIPPGAITITDLTVDEQGRSSALGARCRSDTMAFDAQARSWRTTS